MNATTTGSSRNIDAELEELSDQLELLAARLVELARKLRRHAALANCPKS